MYNWLSVRFASNRTFHKPEDVTMTEKPTTASEAIRVDYYLIIQEPDKFDCVCLRINAFAWPAAVDEAKRIAVILPKGYRVHVKEERQQVFTSERETPPA
jgi:hypothetical protein